MIKTIYVCDKCLLEVATVYTLDYPSPTSKDGIEQKDLCRRCLDLFIKWIETPIDSNVKPTVDSPVEPVL